MYLGNHLFSSIGTWIGLDPKPVPIETASFIFFHGSTFAEHTFFGFSRICELLNHPKFDVGKETVLYAHGYIESPAEESVSVLVDAYLKRGDHNILILDWMELADGHYIFEALPNTKRVR
jgi:Lipase